MIIKSLSRTSGSATGLLNYMFQEEKMKHLLEYQAKEGKIPSPFSVRHLVKGKNISEWIGEFQQNQQERKYKRVGGVICYHDIISFATKDTESLDDQTLTDITRQYIKLRSPDAPAVATFHRDVGHTHIHLALAGSKYKTGLANRISKNDFAGIKQSMENYQRKRYPNLIYSHVNHGVGKGNENEKERQVSKRTRKPSKRDNVRNRLESVFSQVASEEELYQALEQENMPHYSRGDKVYGVNVDGRNYRFSSLGFDDKLEEIRENEQVLEELDNLRSGDGREQEQMDSRLEQFDNMESGRSNIRPQANNRKRNRDERDDDRFGR